MFDVTAEWYNYKVKNKKQGQSLQLLVRCFVVQMLARVNDSVVSTLSMLSQLSIGQRKRCLRLS